MKIKKYYKIKGYVYGNYWGGGKGAYVSESAEGDNLEQLMIEAKNALEDGSLDGGMGYESLIGAILDIQYIEKIEYKGKIYHNSQYNIEFIGDLTEEEEEFLDDVLMND